ncbi:MAG: hypothetical protein PHC61_11890 [Chitinivibrionales bacterium]|nr:hypothetical protein [Chitinivibrionales bacterium]
MPAKIFYRARLISALLLLGIYACSTGPVQSTTPETGTLKGRVVTPGNYGLPYHFLLIYGTNFIATTDSLGYYCFYDMPRGHYIITDLGYISIAADVVAGDTVRLPDLVINDGSNYLSGLYAISNLAIYDAAADTFLINSLAADYYSVSSNSYTNNYYVYFLKADSITLQFVIQDPSCSYSDCPLIIKPTKIIHNGKIAYSAVPEKGRVRTNPIKLCGLDSFSVVVDSGTLVGTIVIMDSSSVQLAESSDRRLYLSVAPTTIDASGYFPGGRFIAAGDTFSVEFAAQDPIDWDLYFVNDSSGDTCYWYNPNPDWGTKLSSEDDPQFSGDGYRYGLDNSGMIERRYEPDNISCMNMADGTYSIYVKYFDGPPDSTAATPQLTVELGWYMNSGIIAGFFQDSPATPLHKGEVWNAGKIKIPQLEYVPNLLSKRRVRMPAPASR